MRHLHTRGRIASTVDDIQQELNNVSKLLRGSQRETPLSSERSEVEEDPAEVARREYMSNRRKSLSLASAAELATMSKPVKNDPPLEDGSCYDGWVTSYTH